MKYTNLKSGRIFFIRNDMRLTFWNFFNNKYFLSTLAEVVTSGRKFSVAHAISLSKTDRNTCLFYKSRFSDAAYCKY